MSDMSADARFAAVYPRLRQMAANHLAQAHSNTLSPTVLVHELYLRVRKRNELAFVSDLEFFAYAAKAMRHVLADHARAALAQKAGGGWQSVTLSHADESEVLLESAERYLGLDKALEALGREDERAVRVVELRYFAGLTLEQIAGAMGLVRRTVDRDWQFARAFLAAELDD